MKNKYSFSEFISNIWALLITKLFFRGARLIRRPVYIRGRKSFVFKRGLTLGHGCRFDLPGDRKTLYVGENCQFGDMTHITAHEKVSVGDNVLMASKVYISDCSHGSYSGENQSAPNTVPKDRDIVTAPVSIGNNVWIGENVVVLAGSEIGDGCVVGANAVVKGKFPADCMLVGAPARIVKRYNYESSQWEKSN